MPLEHDLITAINDELLRIEAREKAHDHKLGHGDRVHYEDSGEGNVTLGGSAGGHDFRWFGPATEFLQRLRKVSLRRRRRRGPLGVLVGAKPRLVTRRRVDAPSPGHALELVVATLVKLDAGAGDEVLDGLGHENSPPFASDATRAPV